MLQADSKCQGPGENMVGTEESWLWQAWNGGGGGHDTHRFLLFSNPKSWNSVIDPILLTGPVEAQVILHTAVSAESVFELAVADCAASACACLLSSSAGCRLR